MLAVLTRMGTSVAAWSSSYGVLVVIKATALVGLGVVGHVHRRRTLPRLRRHPRGAGPFLRLSAIELALMGTAMGLAAALSRTSAPTPQVGRRAEPRHGAHDAAGLGGAGVHHRARNGLAPNAIVLVVVGLSLCLYLLGVRTERRQRGD